MSNFARITLSALLVSVLSAPLLAHEFWINPRAYQVDPGKDIRADFRNGEIFDGTQLAFFDRSSSRLQVATPSGVNALKPRSGDRPAIDFSATQSGLHILLHETTPSRLTYKTWEKWQKFVKGKDLSAVSARHDARGLPRENFKEAYTRHAKALVGVGSGEGADRAFGLEIEFVAKANPYASSYGGTMTAQLLYRGKPLGDTQVEVFERPPSGKVRVTKLRTNANGSVSLKTRPDHEYLFDAVLLREPTRADRNVAWETVWAALTFQHPPR